jgi:flavin-dependent dehydrogenase
VRHPHKKSARPGGVGSSGSSSAGVNRRLKKSRRREFALDVEGIENLERFERRLERRLGRRDRRRLRQRRLLRRLGAVTAICALVLFFIAAAWVTLAALQSLIPWAPQ